MHNARTFATYSSVWTFRISQVLEAIPNNSKRLLLISHNVPPPPPLRHPTLQRKNPTAVFAVFECKGKQYLWNMQKRSEKFADIRKSTYLCSVMDNNSRLVLLLNFETMKNNLYYRKCRFVRFLHKMITFMLQNFVNNRNFAIFAPQLAYEVQWATPQIRESWLDFWPCRGKPLLLYKGWRHDRADTLSWVTWNRKRPC